MTLSHSRFRISKLIRGVHFRFYGVRLQCQSSLVLISATAMAGLSLSYKLWVIPYCSPIHTALINVSSILLSWHYRVERCFQQGNIISFLSVISSYFKNVKTEAKPRLSRGPVGNWISWRVIFCSYSTYGENEAQFSTASVIYTQPWILHPLQWCQLTLTSNPRKISFPSVLWKQMARISPRRCKTQAHSLTSVLRGMYFHHDRADAGRQCWGLLWGNDVCKCCVSDRGMLMQRPSQFPPWKTNHWHSWIALTLMWICHYGSHADRQNWNSY